MKYLYHIARESDWEQAQQDGYYAVGSLHRDFDADGFIHLSYSHQVNVVADSIYGTTPNLVLLKINPSKLTSSVKDEQAKESHEVFPHLYGRLNLDAVESFVPYMAAEDGKFPAIKE